MCRVLPATVDCNNEREQDSHIIEQCWGCTQSGQVVCHCGGQIGRFIEDDEESEQDVSLVCTQDIAGHCGQLQGERTRKEEKTFTNCMKNNYYKTNKNWNYNRKNSKN